MQKSYPGLKIRKMMRSDIPKIVSIISRDLGALDGKKAKRDMTEQQQKLYVDGQVFVAEDKSGLLGVIGYWHMPYHPKKVCWMDWFGVEKNHKRMGIGSALLSHMLNFLAKKKYKMICCEKSSKDIPAKLFYEKHGFKESGKIAGYWEDGGNWIVLVKRI